MPRQEVTCDKRDRTGTTTATKLELDLQTMIFTRTVSRTLPGLLRRPVAGPFCSFSRRFLHAASTSRGSDGLHAYTTKRALISREHQPIQNILRNVLNIGWASSVTPQSSVSDPAETEALRCLEQGTSKLEEGDLESAKAFYQRSNEIKRSASSLFNLGVTHYHLSKLSSCVKSLLSKFY